ncbi:hypothetical protein DPMN_114568 [Dreissena polymorpha]|uniref:Uncharacterized protein n=1 Tax=Dreissena polymorpha TaxID=45954 RepID=A0A9D4QRP0_DREPO|nr:hypothetical protein DPMN_114568 [Dreissena polymorpha]
MQDKIPRSLTSLATFSRKLVLAPDCSALVRKRRDRTDTVPYGALYEGQGRLLSMPKTYQQRSQDVKKQPSQG